MVEAHPSRSGVSLPGVPSEVSARLTKRRSNVLLGKPDGRSLAGRKPAPPRPARQPRSQLAPGSLRPADPGELPRFLQVKRASGRRGPRYAHTSNAGGDLPPVRARRLVFTQTRLGGDLRCDPGVTFSWAACTRTHERHILASQVRPDAVPAIGAGFPALGQCHDPPTASRPPRRVRSDGKVEQLPELPVARRLSEPKRQCRSPSPLVIDNYQRPAPAPPTRHVSPRRPPEPGEGAGDTAPCRAAGSIPGKRRDAIQRRRGAPALRETGASFDAGHVIPTCPCLASAPYVPIPSARHSTPP